MRAILSLLLLLLPSAEGAAVLVTKSDTGNHLGVNNPTITDTFGTLATGTSSSATATLLILVASASSGVDPCNVANITVSDKVGGVATGNNWHASVSRLATSLNGICAWYAFDSASGALVTGASHIVTATGFTNTPVTTVWFSAFKGTKTSSTPYDVTRDSGSSSTSTSFRTGTVTPVSVGDLLFSFCTPRLFQVTSTSPLTTPPDSIAWASGTVNGLYDVFDAAANTSAFTQTCTIGGTGTMAMGIISFESSGGTPAKVVRRVIQ